MVGGSPQFRRDLESAAVEADGVVYVEVVDRRSGQSFRFYDFEHTVALAMDGRPLPEVAQDLLQRCELDLSPEQLAAFAEQLQALGFLDEPADSAATAAPAPAPTDAVTAGAAATAAPPVGEAAAPPAAAVPSPAAAPAGTPANQDSFGIPGFFPPLAADESGHFAGPGMGFGPSRTPGPSLSAHSDLPSAVDPASQEKTPAPVTFGPKAIRPTGKGGGVPGIDRTFTSFPPELLPADWLATPAPEMVPPAATAAGAAKDDGALTPVPVSPRGGKRLSLSELGSARETTPPPVPADARASVAPSKPEARPETDNALTTEMDVVSMIGGDGTALGDAGSDDATGSEITSAGMDLSQFHIHEMEAGAAAAPAPPEPAFGAAAPPRAATTESVTEPTPVPLKTSMSTTTSAAGSTPAPEAPVPVHVPEPSASRPRDFAHVLSSAAGEHSTDTDPREFPTRELEAVELSMGFLHGAGNPEAADSAAGDTATATAAAPAATTKPAETKPADSETADAKPAAPPEAATSSTAGVIATPAPTAAVDDPLPSGKPGRGGWKTGVVFAALAIAAAVVIGVMGFRVLESTEPPQVVKVMSAAPQTVFRYWDANGFVSDAKATGLSFQTGGKIVEIASIGTKFAPGDVLALLESGRRFRNEQNHANERLVHYQGVLEKMTAEGNRPEIRQAELKVAEKKRLMAEAQANLAKHAIIATESGEVSEVLFLPQDVVPAGEVVLRPKGLGYRVTFELPRDQVEKARQLGFCRAAIEGKILVDCGLSADGNDETHLTIELPNDPSVAVGKLVRLARDRLDAVYVLPLAAVVRVGDSDRVFIVGDDGAAVMRAVGLAERTNATPDVIVTQGLEAGDRVIIHPPSGLQQGSRVIADGP